MSHSSLVPRILIRGRWSTQRVKSVRPSKKNLHLVMAQATAPASPSIGAWRDSAGLLKVLLQNTVFQPPEQQPGLAGTWAHLQCFWHSHRPHANLDQSVARAVGRAGS